MWLTLGENSFEIWQDHRRLRSFRNPDAGFLLAQALEREGRLQANSLQFLHRETYCLQMRAGRIEPPSTAAPTPSRLATPALAGQQWGSHRIASPNHVPWQEGTPAILLGGLVIELTQPTDLCLNTPLPGTRGRIESNRFVADAFTGCRNCIHHLRGLLGACTVNGPIGTTTPSPLPADDKPWVLAWFGPRRAEAAAGGPAPLETLLA